MSLAAKMENIVKIFPGTLANDNISLEVIEGEILCLLGENGAGKSTLMNILYGLYSYDEGKIFIKGKQVHFKGPADSIKMGIGMVHQDFMLIPVFTVLENLMLGSELVKGLSLDIEKAKLEIVALSEKYKLNIDPDARVENITVGMQQRVEILKLLYKGADIMIFDEPTSILTPQEIGELYKIMNFLREQGKTLIFITHKLDEVMEISDRVTVLRDGRVIDTMDTDSTNPRNLARMMVGRDVLFTVDKPEVKIGKNILKLENLYAKNNRGLPSLEGINLGVNEGEVLGIAGIDGNGQTELVEVLAGLRKTDSGRIILDGKDLTNKSPKELLEEGMAYIQENRLVRGLIADFSLYENLLLGFQDSKPFARGITIDFKRVKSWAAELLKKYDVRPPNIEVNAVTLSGGNQQKLVIAREFERHMKLLVASQPTRGLDVGATEFVHKQIMKVKEAGNAILLLSLELSEIMNLSDRILVLYEGKIMGEFKAGEVEEAELGLLMAGGKL